MAERSSIHRGRIFANVFLQGFAVLALFVMANYLGFAHFKRWDYSRDQKYTLSEQTRRVLEKLDQPLKLTIFFSNASPINFDTVTLAREYASFSEGKIDVEVVNPYLHLTRAREIATQYKLGDRENVLIIDYGGNTQFINAEKMAEYEPSLNPNDPPRLKAFMGESAITSAILAVTEEGTSALYTLSGHGEPTFDHEAYSGLKTFIERQNIAIAPLSLAETRAIPEDARLLVINGPKYDFTDREIELLNQYWQRKGRLFIFLEPGAPTPKLNAFVAKLGITPRNDRVLQTVPLGQQLTGIRKEITGDFVPGSPITRRLGNVNAIFLGVTQSLLPDPQRVKTANIRLQPLVQASKGFWGEKFYDVNTPGGVFFDSNEDLARPFVAVSAEQGAASDERVQVDTSRLIVVGNTAFLTNEAMTSADLDFVLSGLNWLMARESLIGIAPKDVRNFSLNLSASELNTLAAITIGVIPGLAAVLGLFSWIKRRR
ncbi:MAG TPA: GldG family protein [Chthoniobacteraceae bacterium]|nr:GldG family protein [Chthoniobacteraceae bacterium]